MKTEPMSSPAILHAVAGYQAQRADLVAQLKSHTDGYIDHMETRTQPLVKAIAVIDERIEKLCLRLVHTP